MTEDQIKSLVDSRTNSLGVEITVHTFDPTLNSIAWTFMV